MWHGQYVRTYVRTYVQLGIYFRTYCTYVRSDSHTYRFVEFSVSSSELVPSHVQ